MKELTHMDSRGEIKMVDIEGKKPLARKAVARSRITMKPASLKRVMNLQVSKGDVFNAARLAGIMAAKKTSELIPLCHPLPLSAVTVSFSSDPGEGTVEIEASVKTVAKTGVEMEALTAVAVAALTVYDMIKAIDDSLEIGGIRLLSKEKKEI